MRPESANLSRELVALALFWLPGFQLVGTVCLGFVLLGALATLIRYHEGASHLALTGLTLLLIVVQFYLPKV
jgi:hypothetical protein